MPCHRSPPVDSPFCNPWRAGVHFPQIFHLVSTPKSFHLAVSVCWAFFLRPDYMACLHRISGSGMCCLEPTEMVWVTNWCMPMWFKLVKKSGNLKTHLNFYNDFCDNRIIIKRVPVIIIRSTDNLLVSPCRTYPHSWSPRSLQARCVQLWIQFFPPSNLPSSSSDTISSRWFFPSTVRLDPMELSLVVLKC